MLQVVTLEWVGPWTIHWGVVPLPLHTCAKVPLGIGSWLMTMLDNAWQCVLVVNMQNLSIVGRVNIVSLQGWFHWALQVLLGYIWQIVAMIQPHWYHHVHVVSHDINLHVKMIWHHYGHVLPCHIIFSTWLWSPWPWPWLRIAFQFPCNFC